MEINIIPDVLNFTTDQAVLYLKRPEINIPSSSPNINIFGQPAIIHIYKNGVHDSYDFTCRMTGNLGAVSGVKMLVRFQVVIGSTATQVEKKVVAIIENITNMWRAKWSMIDSHVPDGYPESRKVIKIVLKLISSAPNDALSANSDGNSRDSEGDNSNGSSSTNQSSKNETSKESAPKTQASSKANASKQTTFPADTSNSVRLKCRELLANSLKTEDALSANSDGNSRDSEGDNSNGSSSTNQSSKNETSKESAPKTQASSKANASKQTTFPADTSNSVRLKCRELLANSLKTEDALSANSDGNSRDSEGDNSNGSSSTNQSSKNETSKESAPKTQASSKANASKQTTFPADTSNSVRLKCRELLANSLKTEVPGIQRLCDMPLNFGIQRRGVSGNEVARMQDLRAGSVPSATKSSAAWNGKKRGSSQETDVKPRKIRFADENDEEEESQNEDKGKHYEFMDTTEDVVSTSSMDRQKLEDIPVPPLPSSPPAGLPPRLPQGQRGQDREVVLTLKHAVEAKSYDSIAEVGRLKPLEVELQKLEDLSESIVKDFAYMRQRESEMRDTNGPPPPPRMLPTGVPSPPPGRPTLPVPGIPLRLAPPIRLPPGPPSCTSLPSSSTTTDILKENLSSYCVPNIREDQIVPDVDRNLDSTNETVTYPENNDKISPFDFWHYFKRN